LPASLVMSMRVVVLMVSVMVRGLLDHGMKAAGRAGRPCGAGLISVDKRYQ
jgi:hypothetical protein